MNHSKAKEHIFIGWKGGALQMETICIQKKICKRLNTVATTKAQTYLSRYWLFNKQISTSKGKQTDPRNFPVERQNST